MSRGDRQLLSLSTLKDFDFGKANAAFQSQLTAAVRDCLDRPGDSAARMVVLEVSIKPVMLQDGDVVDAVVQFFVSMKRPKLRTAERPLGITRTGDLFFSEAAPDNPRQPSLVDRDEEDEEEEVDDE
jgi:hypothetical protein